VERLLRKPGDNPGHPYILKLAYTGTAAANIKGKILHSALAFNFGNAYMSLNDKARDEKRICLQNLTFLVIDEYSFIDADLLYKLDLRLKEVKQRTYLDFGGVAVIFFGDILQLKPVRARYICEEPINENYLLGHMISPLWLKFDVILLTTNHRQGEDHIFADLLNRAREGILTDDDVKLLETRVRPKNHPDIPRNTLTVTCINKKVNAINEEMQMLLDTQEFSFDAMITSGTQKNINPRLDSSGAIKNTPLQKNLKLKVGSKVMLTYNVDTLDCLTNGSFGEVLGFQFGNGNVVLKIIVHFLDADCGEQRRKKNPTLLQQYPGTNATAIERMEFPYSFSKKADSTSKNAKVVQFPLRLAFGATAHKVQGQTVFRPNSMSVDLVSVREAAQGYVMISRVETFPQLFILDEFPADKIYPSSIAMAEHDRLKQMSSKKETDFKRFIVSCNIRSLPAHFLDIMSSSFIDGMGLKQYVFKKLG